MSDTPTIFSTHQAAKEGNTLLLKKASKKDLNREDEDGWTPVHWAAWNGSVEALKMVLSKGCVANSAPPPNLTIPTAPPKIPSSPCVLLSNYLFPIVTGVMQIGLMGKATHLSILQQYTATRVHWSYWCPMVPIYTPWTSLAELQQK